MPERCENRPQPSHRDFGDGITSSGVIQRRLGGQKCAINLRQMHTTHATAERGSTAYPQATRRAREAPPAKITCSSHNSRAPSKHDGHAEPPPNRPKRVATSTNITGLTFYPAYAFKVSPTYFVWVKLTIRDIHDKLQHKSDYLHSWVLEAGNFRHPPQLVFYQNHPIQFVQIIGIVVSFEEYFESFWLFTLDDSSGATIDVICPKPKGLGVPNEQDSLSDDEKQRRNNALRLSEQVSSGLVYVGAVLQVKGTVTVFQRRKENEPHLIGDGQRGNAIRGTTLRSDDEAPVRQITLDRFTAILDTSHEVALINSRSAFYAAVLSNPWKLTRQELDMLRKAAVGEAEDRRKRIRRQTQRQKEKSSNDVRDAEAILKEYAEEERGRGRAAEEARLAGNALPQPPYSTSRLPGATRTDTGTLRNVPKTRIHEAGVSVFKATAHERRDSSTVATDIEHCDTSTFAADDAEKFALLRAAFG